LTETVTGLARRIVKRGARADVLALCRLVLRRAKRNAAHVRRWRKTHVDPKRTGPNREAYLAKQREYMRKYYRKRKRQRQRGGNA
jgi:hypothetical protein